MLRLSSISRIRRQTPPSPSLCTCGTVFPLARQSLIPLFSNQTLINKSGAFVIDHRDRIAYSFSREFASKKTVAASPKAKISAKKPTSPLKIPSKLTVEKPNAKTASSSKKEPLPPKKQPPQKHSALSPKKIPSKSKQVEKKVAPLVQNKSFEEISPVITAATPAETVPQTSLSSEDAISALNQTISSALQTGPSAKPPPRIYTLDQLEVKKSKQSAKTAGLVQNETLAQPEKAATEAELLKSKGDREPTLAAVSTDIQHAQKKASFVPSADVWTGTPKRTDLKKDAMEISDGFIHFGPNFSFPLNIDRSVHYPALEWSPDCLPPWKNYVETGAGSSSNLLSASDWAALSLPHNKKLLEEILIAFSLQQHVLLSGPTGTGKTWFVKIASKLINRGELHMVSLNEYTKNEDLTSRTTFGEEGSNKTGISKSTVLQWMDSGGILLLDEIHKPLEGISVLNNILQYGEFRLPNGAMIQIKHPKDSFVVATMNPPVAPYKGEALSAELVSRFPMKLLVNHLPHSEEVVLLGLKARNVPQKTLAQLVHIANDIRQAAEVNNKLAIPSKTLIQMVDHMDRYLHVNPENVFLRYYNNLIFGEDSTTAESLKRILQARDLGRFSTRFISPLQHINEQRANFLHGGGPKPVHGAPHLEEKDEDTKKKEIAAFEKREKQVDVLTQLAQMVTGKNIEMVPSNIWSTTLDHRITYNTEELDNSELCFGALFHETFHWRYRSMDAASLAMYPAKLTPIEKDAFKHLWNTVEDMRINRLGLGEFPGAKPWLDVLYKNHFGKNVTDQIKTFQPYARFNMRLVQVQWNGLLDVSTTKKPMFAEKRMNALLVDIAEVLKKAVGAKDVAECHAIVKRDIWPKYKAVLLDKVDTPEKPKKPEPAVDQFSAPKEGDNERQNEDIEDAENADDTTKNFAPEGDDNEMFEEDSYEADLARSFGEEDGEATPMQGDTRGGANQVPLLGGDLVVTRSELAKLQREKGIEEQMNPLRNLPNHPSMHPQVTPFTKKSDPQGTCDSSHFDYTFLKSRTERHYTTIREHIKRELKKTKRSSYLTHQTKGELDTSRLFMIPTLESSSSVSANIFKTQALIRKPNFHISLLIDTSLSMKRKFRILYAAETAVMFAEALNDLRGVKFEIVEFSTTSNLIKAYEDRLDDAKKSLIARSIYPGGQTSIQKSLEEVVSRMSAIRGDKFVIIITDGDYEGTKVDFKVCKQNRVNVALIGLDCPSLPLAYPPGTAWNLENPSMLIKTIGKMLQNAIKF